MAHIGIDARLTYYRVGGISTYIKRTIQALEQLDISNQYTIFHSRKAKDSLVTRFNHAKLWTPSHHKIERLALSVELFRHKLDLYHSPDFIPPIRGAKRHIITVHDLTFLHYPQYLTSDSRAYYNDQIEVAVNQADHILSDSEATKRDLIDMLNVPAEKITVHMLGVDEKFQPLPQEKLETVRKELDIPSNYMLFVGTFEPRKNIIGLLKSYRDLRSQLPDAPSLLLVGRRGWLFDETMAKLGELGIKEHVVWRDNVSDEQLPAVYNMAQVLVTPSFYEGFGLPALEAMACGTVPIVSNRSSLPEIVGDVGLQIDPDNLDTLTDALYKTITDSDWRKSQEAAAIKRAAIFKWEETAKIVLNTYQSVL